MSIQEALRRLSTLPYAAITGASTTIPPNLERHYHTHPNLDPNHLNHHPYPEDILPLISQTISDLKPHITQPESLDIHKTHILLFYWNFSDTQKSNLLPEFFHQPNQSHQLEQAFLGHFLSTHEPLGLHPQLQLALEITDNHLVEALYLLALTTRAKARGLDTTLAPYLDITPQGIRKWQNILKLFDYDPTLEQQKDPAGDTYHFWGAVFAGCATNLFPHNPYHQLTKSIANFSYQHTQTITQILRHQLARKPGTTHSTIDLLGFSIGLALAQS